MGLALQWRTAARVASTCPLKLPAILQDRAALARAPQAEDAPRSVLTRTLGRVAVASAADVDEIREIAVSNMYCAPGFLPRAGCTVVDVGANVGIYTLWAASFMTSGTILAIEPVPSSFSLLQDNVAARARAGRGPSVVVADMAITDRQGTVRLLVPSAYPGWACHPESPCAGDFAQAPGTRWLDVRGDCLDAVTQQLLTAPQRRRIDLMKVDVEGMEAECFLGAPATLARTVRVVFEYHTRAVLQRCAAVLRTAGFQEVHRRHPYNPEIGLSFWRAKEPVAVG